MSIIYNKEKEKKGIVFSIFGLLLLALFSGSLLYGLNYFSTLDPIIVSGTSMYPTLHEKDRLFIQRTKDIHRNDIVSFKAPDDQNKYYIKRTIAVSGDTLEYKDDVLYINGKEQPEPYLTALRNREKKYNQNYSGLMTDFTLETLNSTQTLQVPENHIFVMGDNRVDSKDSRFFGFVHLDLVEGIQVSNPILDMVK